MTDTEKLEKLKNAVQQILNEREALAKIYGPDAECIFQYAPELARALGSLAGPLLNLIQIMHEIE